MMSYNEQEKGETMADTSEIDLVKYGVLWEKVQMMDKRVEKIEEKMDQLLELANRSKGGLWLGITLISSISALIAIAIKFWKG